MEKELNFDEYCVKNDNTKDELANNWKDYFIDHNLSWNFAQYVALLKMTNLLKERN